MSFEQDLISGKEAEELASKFFNGTPLRCDDGKYDFIITSTYEVKKDMKAEDTGNIAFEIRYNSKPSGVSSTQAEWIIYQIGKKFYICRVKEVRDYLKANSWRLRIVNGGDADKSEIILISLFEFIQLFNQLQ